MPDENKIEVTRNNVVKVFSPQEIKRGESKGEKYFGLEEEVTPENLQSFVDFITPASLAPIVDALMRQRCINWTRASTKEDTNEFSVEAFTKYVEEFSARGEGIGALQKKLDELQDKLIEVAENKQGLEGIKVAAKISEYGEQMRQIREVIETKRRSKKESQDEETTGNAQPAVAVK